VKRKAAVDLTTDSEVYRPIGFIRVFEIGEFTVVSRIGIDFEKAAEGAHHDKIYAVLTETYLYPMGMIAKTEKAGGTLEAAVDALKALTQDNAEDFLASVIEWMKMTPGIWD